MNLNFADTVSTQGNYYYYKKGCFHKATLKDHTATKYLGIAAILN
ncbi:MAG: hypothetical protein ACI9XU_001101 [Arenicella sp.]|jgi:hypothetical protein